MLTTKNIAIKLVKANYAILSKEQSKAKRNLNLL